MISSSGHCTIFQFWLLLGFPVLVAPCFPIGLCYFFPVLVAAPYFPVLLTILCFLVLICNASSFPVLVTPYFPVGCCSAFSHSFFHLVFFHFSPGQSVGGTNPRITTRIAAFICQWVTTDCGQILQATGIANVKTTFSFTFMELQKNYIVI